MQNGNFAFSLIYAEALRMAKKQPRRAEAQKIAKMVGLFNGLRL